MIDAGVGVAFLATVLLYLRYERKFLAATEGVSAPVGPWRGSIELLLGMGAILWTGHAF